jgi:hypothetical protein
MGTRFQKTIQYIRDSTRTEIVNGKETVSNYFSLLELKGREKILRWDTSNDFARIEMEVEHFISSDGHRTNRLDQPGTILLGEAILGELYFRTSKGQLPREFDSDFKGCYEIRPSRYNEFDQKHLPPTMRAGETLQIIPKPRTDREIQPPGKSTDSFSGELKFVGPTNMFGSDCFHVALHGKQSGLNEGLTEVMSHIPTMKTDLEGETSIHLVAPLEGSQPFFLKSQEVHMTVSANGAAIGSSKLLATAKLILISEPIK